MNRLLSFDDIEAGKMCVAPDRQHRRDLFGIALLVEDEGISCGLLEACSRVSNRPQPAHRRAPRTEPPGHSPTL